MIEPQYQSMYLWDFMQKGKTINVGIKCPENFDPNQIQAVLSEDKKSIIVSFPDQPPILAGELFKTVLSIATKAFQNTFILAIFTDSEEIWPSICIGPHKETRQIDPLTAFSIFKVNTNSSDEMIVKGGMEFLMHSISLGFYPALLAAYDIFHNDKNEENRKKAYEYLNLAANKYNSHQAHFQIGLNIISENGNIEDAMTHFQIAAKMNNVYAKSFIGFILSPLSEFIYPKKDAKRAAEIFEEVLKTIEDPTTYHEYAKLLYNGCGVELNEKRAFELQEKAKSLVKDVPELTKIDLQNIEKQNKEQIPNEAIKNDNEKQIEENKDQIKHPDPESQISDKISNENPPAKPAKPTQKKSPEILRLDAINRKVDALSKEVQSLHQKLDLVISLLTKQQNQESV